MGDIAALIQQYGLALIALLVVSSALSYVARLLYRELTRRAERSEELVDRFVPALDRLADAIEKQNDIVEAILADREERP